MVILNYRINDFEVNHPEGVDFKSYYVVSEYFAIYRRLLLLLVNNVMHTSILVLFLSS